MSEPNSHRKRRERRDARKARIIRENPLCYFCGSSSETIDHVPARETFKRGIGPDDIEYAACKRCNHGSSQIEQVVALYIHMADQGTENSSLEQYAKLIRGIQNNSAIFLPDIELSANFKRNAAREWGYKLGAGQTYADAPFAVLPPENREAFRLFARRLTCALYFKHLNAVMPLDHVIATHQIPTTRPDAQRVVQRLGRNMRFWQGSRIQKTDLSDQFSYLWNSIPEEQLFTFVAKFHNSFFVFGCGCRAGSKAEQRHAHWISHREDVPARVARRHVASDV